MINPDAEVDRLRMTLMHAGYDLSDADLICDAASDDINELMLDIASNAITEATEYAAQIGAEDFIEDIDVVPTGGTFMITTRSGRTDYSEPERKMLPDLVKGGKMAADGSQYKVIPIKKTEKASIPTSMFDMLRDQQQQQTAAKNALKQELVVGRAKSQGSMQERMRALVNNTRASRKGFYESSRPKVISTDVEFRTASDKQDADTTWVRPERELDMTGFLMELNNKIEHVLFDSVRFLVDSYQEEYA